MALDYPARLPARTPPDLDRAPDWWPYAGEFPDWHVWRGVTGLLYARRPKSSPPKVVHGDSPGELRDQIIHRSYSRADVVADLEQHASDQERFGGPMPAGL